MRGSPNKIAIEARNKAIRSGNRRFFTGLPCRNGHVAERYVSTGECIACLKTHIPTREAKRQTTARFLARKKITDPAYVARRAREYKAKYHLKARIDKMFHTAQRHARNDKVTLDFGIDFIKQLLEAACESSGVVIKPFSPRTASLDKKNNKLPISKNNIQVVPHWYNRAKRDWDEDDFIAAMSDYGFMRHARIATKE